MLLTADRWPRSLALHPRKATEVEGSMTSRTEYSTQTPKKSTLFSGQYLRNRSTLNIGTLGYIGRVWPKEHSPEVSHIPPVTPCIYIISGKCILLSTFCIQLALEEAKFWFLSDRSLIHQRKGNFLTASSSDILQQLWSVISSCRWIQSHSMKRQQTSPPQQSVVTNKQKRNLHHLHIILTEGSSSLITTNCAYIVVIKGQQQVIFIICIRSLKQDSKILTSEMCSLIYS